jgi:heat shock protein HslJ
MRLTHLTLLATLLTFGCSSEPADVPDDTDTDTDTDTGTPDEIEGLELIGLNFILDSSDGYDPVVGTTIRLGFIEGSSGGLAFDMYADCNSMDGDMTLEDGVMTVDEVAGTDLGCATEFMDQDTWLTAFVMASPTLELSGDTLTLTGATATLIFLNEDVVVPDQALAGDLWTVDTYIAGQSVSNFNLAVPPTILFKQDGTVSAFTGCNEGSGSYVATVNEITFSQLAYTKMACADATVASAESFMIRVINNGTSSYEIDGTRLTVSSGDTGVSATVK